MADSFAGELQRVVDAFNDAEHRAHTQAQVDAVVAAGATSREALIALALALDGGDARSTACWLLGRMQIREGVTALVATLRDREPALRLVAAIALRELRDPVALAPLVEVMESDSDLETRVCATLGLGALGAPDASAPLRRMLADRAAPSRVRGAAAEALSDLGDIDAAPALIAALSDREPEVRLFAAFALAALATVPREAQEALERLLDDPAEVPGFGTVGDEARNALEQIRSAVRD